MSTVATILPFEQRRNDFVDRVLATVQLIGAAVMDAARLPATVELLDAVNDLNKERGQPTNPRRVAYAKSLLPLVEAEAKNGFPLYHGLATIGIWAGLEAFVEDLLIACMTHDGTFSDVPAVRKLKVPLLQFEAMSRDERLVWLLENVSVSLESSVAFGAGRFERLLNVFGLGGAVEAELQACLVELSAVRNVLVHRGGRADIRLVSNCPWLGLHAGDEVRVTQRMLSTYGVSAVRYGTLVYQRVMLRFGGDADREDRFLATLPKVARTLQSSSAGSPDAAGNPESP